MIKHENSQAGAINLWMISTIALGILVIVVAILGVDAYNNYLSQKTNIDGKIADATAKAVDQQATKDDNAFAQKEKQPYTEFVGPTNYGRLTFDYPRTWSVYVNQDGTEGQTYAAYLNPVTVPPVGNATQQFALRVTIEEADYGTVVSGYQEQITNGNLKSSVVKAKNGATGTRLDGTFDDGIRGSEVIYEIRDKTVLIRTDADTFLPDFNTLIQTISFNS